MLAEEVEQDAVAALILLLDLFVLEITAAFSKKSAARRYGPLAIDDEGWEGGGLTEQPSTHAPDPKMSRHDSPRSNSS